jgi:hypothetical protein
VPDSADLLAVARLLLKFGAESSTSDAALRRAVSTAYYAVFHHILGAAARRFLGQRHETSAAYAILYRGFDHRRMKEVCEALRATSLRAKYATQLRRPIMSKEIRDFAGVFPNLQEQRELADYDPAASFVPSQVSTLIDSAEFAINAFDHASAEERADALALMLVGARS